MVVLNDAARRILEANGAPPSQIAVNRLGFGHDRVRHTRSRNTSAPVKFAFVGRFDRIKGVYELARAIRRIPRSTDFRFEFRGPTLAAGDRATIIGNSVARPDRADTP